MRNLSFVSRVVPFHACCFVALDWTHLLPFVVVLRQFLSLCGPQTGQVIPSFVVLRFVTVVGAALDSGETPVATATPVVAAEGDQPAAASAAPPASSKLPGETLLYSGKDDC